VPKSTVDDIPAFVIKYMSSDAKSMAQQICLNSIGSTLANSLADFQREGVLMGIARGGRCIIADDMGLGKTRQALAIADFYKEDWPVVIVTNASTREAWGKEINALMSDLTVDDVCYVHSAKDYIGGAQVVIISYSLLEKCLNELLELHPGVAIFDESQSIKNPKAKQTVAAQKLCESMKRIILLSGTPALSRPVELYPQLKIIDKNMPTYNQFTTRYCNGHQTNYGWDATGASNMEELKILLSHKFMIRRKKSEVQTMLLDKKRELVTLLNIEQSNEDIEEFEAKYDANKDGQDNDMLLQWYQATAKLKASAVW